MYSRLKYFYKDYSQNASDYFCFHSSRNYSTNKEACQINFYSILSLSHYLRLDLSVLNQQILNKKKRKLTGCVVTEVNKYCSLSQQSIVHVYININM
jgi:hypothetical protein